MFHSERCSDINKVAESYQHVQLNRACDNCHWKGQDQVSIPGQTLSINQSIIYFNTLRQRAKNLVQNTNVYE